MEDQADVDANKRKANEDSHALQIIPLAKRPRTDLVIAESNDKVGHVMGEQKIARTSNLLAPNMLLEGHEVTYVYYFMCFCPCATSQHLN